MVGLAGMVTIESVPETSGDKFLRDAHDSDDAYSSVMIGKEAGGLLCSLTGMFKIHLSDNGIKVIQTSSLIWLNQT